MKICIKCKIEKPINDFGWRNKLKNYKHSYCKECLLKWKSQWRKSHKESRQLESRNRYIKCKTKCILYTLNRKLEKIKRIPKWANKNKIENFYIKRDKLNTKVGHRKYHVDHIIPLLGKTVSGLHVETNLQILLSTKNIRKSNHY